MPANTPGLRLGRKKIYILPTRHGLAFAGVLAVMLAGAINYNNSLAYGLTFLLISLALISMIHTYRNLAGLTISGRAPGEVFAGSPAGFKISLDNPLGLARQGIVLRESRSMEEPVVSLEIPPNSRKTATVPVATHCRGWQTLDKITIASRAPFGIFRAWSPVPLRISALVYPAPAGAQPLPPPLSQRLQEHGRCVQGRDDFSALREYQPGDSPKRIHWKIAARGDALPVKLFEGSGTGDLLLRAEAVLATESEARLSQLCAWILEAQTRGLKYGLEVGEVRIAPGSGSQHRRECLRRLALYGLAPGAAP